MLTTWQSIADDEKALAKAEAEAARRDADAAHREGSEEVRKARVEAEAARAEKTRAPSATGSDLIDVPFWRKHAPSCMPGCRAPVNSARAAGRCRGARPTVRGGGALDPLTNLAERVNAKDNVC